MQLIGNWKDVLTRAWSMWLMGSAFFLLALPKLADLTDVGLPVSDDFLQQLALIVIGAAMPARVIQQKNLPDEGAPQDETGS